MQKTITASVVGLTKTKRALLDHDYDNYQWWMIFGVDSGLLSCFKAAKRHKQKIITYREYALPLQSRFMKEWLRKKETKLASYWIKIPNSKKKGVGLWLPLQFHHELPERFTIKDSFLKKKRSQYYLSLCIEIKELLQYEPTTVLGIDLGLKNPVTMVDLATKQTAFVGKEMKEVRGKYFYLRRKLGEKKMLKMIKKIKDKEKRKVHALLHQLSKKIVETAVERKAALVIGRLKHLPKEKGRRMNRKLSSFPYYKLTQFIQYKARERGVPCLTVSEAYTSQTCHACGMKGKRVKNWFSCECGYADNADRNAAFNIGTRGLSYMLGSGVVASALKSILWNGQAQALLCEQACGLR